MNTFRGQVIVQIGGKERLVKFGTNALAFLSEATGKELHELNQGIAGIRDLVWAALKAGAMKNKESFDFDIYDVGDWIDEMEQSEFDKISDTLIKSMPKASEDSSKAKKK